MDSTTMNRLIIVGASGHGKVVADIAQLVGYADIVFLDDDSNIKECAGYPVIGNVSSLLNLDGDVIFAIGNAAIRRKFMDMYSNRVFPVLIHPNSVIAEDVVIGEGSVVMAGAVINPSASIGKGCIINTSSSVDHDCIVGDYCHISVGSHLCGTVSVGNETWIGAGATVINNLNISSSCFIGAGSLVIKDIEQTGTYVGVPTRKIK